MFPLTTNKENHYHLKQSVKNEMSTTTETPGDIINSTPISASKESILQTVVGDGSFENLMKERAKVSGNMFL